MYQAGVKNITLYEDKGIDFGYWNALDLRQISNIVSSGSVITVENIQRPELDIENGIGKQGLVKHDYKVKFLFIGDTLENDTTLKELKDSIYGWCFMVEYYSGDYQFFNTPVFCRESKINPHNEKSIEVTMTNPVPSTKDYFEYTPGISSVEIFRWDSELLTFDSEIYTFDYDL